MNDGTLVRKNLFRKGLRTTLLMVSIFTAFFLFGVLGSFNYAFYYAENPNSANRLITINKINFTQPLPLAYLDRIRSIDGVVAASPMNWFGGYYQDPRNQIQTFPVEPEAFFAIYGEDVALTDAEREAFLTNRTGLIIGRPIAERLGFEVGQRIPLRSDIFTNRANDQQVWEFDIVGIYDGPNPAAYTNHEYFRESNTFGNGFMGWVAMKTRAIDENDRIAGAIDAMFENSSAETRTQDEVAFGRAFLGQLGDLNFIITLVVSAAFAAILLIVGNTMWMAVRERTKEIGVMKTLGFSNGRIVRMVLGESMLLSLSGALLGLGLGALALFGMASGLREFVGEIYMSPWVAGIGVALALAFALVTGIAPALNALNLRIVDALGRK